jgi:CheY-like chemotaxis protein
MFNTVTANICGTFLLRLPRYIVFLEYSTSVVAVYIRRLTLRDLEEREEYSNMEEKAYGQTENGSNNRRRQKHNPLLCPHTPKKRYETDTAQTGKEAIERAKAKCYSVALIDVCLPDVNGMDLLGKLDDHGCRMIKIIITGFPTSPPKGGKPADAYLLKPVKPQELLALLEQKTQEN